MNCQKAYKNMRKSIKSWQRQNKQTTIDMATIEIVFIIIIKYAQQSAVMNTEQNIVVIKVNVKNCMYLSEIA